LHHHHLPSDAAAEVAADELARGGPKFPGLLPVVLLPVTDAVRDGELASAVAASSLQLTTHEL
jgi:hypothetical protein